MRIAQVAPLYESVPPNYYGVTKRMVTYLTEELVRPGHEVRLVATADSETNPRRLDECYQGFIAGNQEISEAV
jgi:hypothetical protein